ncbi:MAG: hypothetical protein NWF01_01735 [Candidatus Bathyarchaeota archaeon]|nr:hypothetical protein [Candidatus Bathyarchaeota archaeon]
MQLSPKIHLPHLSIKNTKAWKCQCGCIIPKKDAQLSGGPSYPKGYHVHCPQCGRVVAQYISLKENPLGEKETWIK